MMLTEEGIFQTGYSLPEHDVVIDWRTVFDKHILKKPENLRKIASG